jgi:hypothetical protein
MTEAVVLSELDECIELARGHPQINGPVRPEMIRVAMQRVAMALAEVGYIFDGYFETWNGDGYPDILPQFNPDIPREVLWRACRLSFPTACWACWSDFGADVLDPERPDAAWADELCVAGQCQHPDLD